MSKPRITRATIIQGQRAKLGLRPETQLTDADRVAMAQREVERLARLARIAARATDDED